MAGDTDNVEAIETTLRSTPVAIIWIRVKNEEKTLLFCIYLSFRLTNFIIRDNHLLPSFFQVRPQGFHQMMQTAKPRRKMFTANGEENRGHRYLHLWYMVLLSTGTGAWLPCDAWERLLTLSLWRMGETPYVELVVYGRGFFQVFSLVSCS